MSARRCDHVDRLVSRISHSRAVKVGRALLASVRPHHGLVLLFGDDTDTLDVSRDVIYLLTVRSVHVFARRLEVSRVSHLIASQCTKLLLEVVVVGDENGSSVRAVTIGGLFNGDRGWAEADLTSTSASAWLRTIMQTQIAHAGDAGHRGRHYFLFLEQILDNELIDLLFTWAITEIIVVYLLDSASVLLGHYFVTSQRLAVLVHEGWLFSQRHQLCSLIAGPPSSVHITVIIAACGIGAVLDV